MIKQLPSIDANEAEINEPDSLDLHDKVFDAYYGKLGDKFMRETQRRIHWICSQATGTHILDIGCSQGITSILLGREGKEVTGVDIDSTSIAEAQKHLALEPRQIRENVSFLNTDAGSHSFTRETFDTVILTEVLEHLIQPERLISIASEKLSAGGRLIVTVPFGINDYIDHKKTFYLHEPYQLISKTFKITDVLVLGKWLGIVASRKEKKSDKIETKPFSHQLLKKLESGFLDIERELRNDLAATKTKLNEANVKYHLSTQQIATERKKASDEQSIRKESETHLKLVESQLEKVEKQIQSEQLHTFEVQKSLILAEKSAIRFETELINTKKRLDEANVKYNASTQQISVERKKILEEQSSHNEIETRCNLLESQLEKAEILIEHEKLNTVEIQNSLLLAEKSTVLFETELTNTKKQLDLANSKYRSSSENILSLREKLSNKEASSESLAKEISKLKSLLTNTEELLEKEKESHKLLSDSLESKAIEALEQQEKSLIKHNKSQEIINRLEKNLAELNTSHNDLTRSNTVLKENLLLSSKNHKKNKKITSVVKDKLKKSVKRCKILEGKNNNIEGKLKRANSTLSEAASHIESLDDHLSILIPAYQEETVKTSETEERLIEKSTQLEHAETIISKLNESLSQTQVQAKHVDELKVHLNHANKEIQTTKKQANLLTSESDTMQAKLRDQQYKIEKSKIENVRNRVDITQSNHQIENLRKQVQTANQKAAKARATLSFQLGHALIFGPKSISNFKSLPGQLWTLRKEAKTRRVNNKIKPFHKPSLAHTPAKFAPPLVTTSIAEQSTPRLKLVSSLPENFPAMLKALKVATIMDEFTYGSYRDECNLLQLTPQHWQNELENFRPEMLFIESAWRGKDELWGSKVGHMSQEVVSIIDWCHENKVPTVFWNKEDPVHFETFLSTAKMFDYVFTTDIDCIHRYKAALGHEQVFLLPFAAQPTLSNPIEKYQRKDAFCFAGAYYTRYPDRTRDLGNFIATLPEFKPVEIYDRNYEKDDPNYKFPAEYQPFIVGNLPFNKIDKAYKGYNYAINLNSIKQSQSMFARRVFELLASNTISVSNFSRGIRLLFGDLLITTDNGMEAVRRLEKLASNEHSARKLRLAALRKVMREHTYQDRLAYVVSKVRNQKVPDLLPHIMVTAYAKNQQQADSILKSFKQQSHTNKSLTLVVPGGFKPANLSGDKIIQVIPAPEAQNKNLNELAAAKDWLAVMVPDDYYGPNYLLDLSIATRYAQAPVIGKASTYVFSTSTAMSVSKDGNQYRRVSEIPARSGIMRIDHIQSSNLRDWVSTLYTWQFEHQDTLSIDEFNYCKNAAADGFDSEQQAVVDDLPDLNTGLALNEIISQAEKIPPEAQDTADVPQLDGEALAKLFSKPPARTQVSTIIQGKSLQIDSALADGKHEYWYAAKDHSPKELGAKNANLDFHLEVTPGLNIQLTLLFLDAQKQRIGHVVKTANRNHQAELPASTAYVRLGLRVYAAGSARIHSLFLGHRKLQPAEILATGEHLLLTNHYPSDDDLYRNGFVHSRVAAYKKQGLNVDVFRLRSGEALSYHEFGDVDCITGSQEALHQLLSSGRHKSVMVHFLDEAMWDVLQHHVDRIKIIVWVHGAEIQPFHRREYNYNTEEERKAGKVQSDKRMKFWRGVLRPMPSNLKLIFVSRYFAEEVMEDIGFRLPDSQYNIIHNPINMNQFNYEPKPALQRKKILSIRPFASAKYANDLSVEAILRLSTKPWFNELEFRIIGDGVLFEETLLPLHRFTNVHIEQRFLSQNEIAQLHKSYGLFLCPTRMDAQGVSRDEAMASGLVPITNAVAAIPEFVDEHCGILAPGEDAEAMAKGIERLYQDPELFVSMSKAATQRVQVQTCNKLIIGQEIQEIKNKEVENDSSKLKATA